MLTDAQVERYSRQIILPNIGGRGQERLLASTVAVVDPDASLALCVDYLAAAGIGCIRIFESPRPSAGSECAAECRIEHEPGAAAPAIAAADVVVDARSAPAAAQLLDVCQQAEHAFVWVSAAGSRTSVVRVPAGVAFCGRCLQRTATHAAGTVDRGGGGGIDWAPFATAWAAAVAATAAVTSILAIGAASPVLMRYDAAAGEVESVALHPDPRCAACGESASA